MAWTHTQIVLTVGIVGCAAVLLRARRRIRAAVAAPDDALSAARADFWLAIALVGVAAFLVWRGGDPVGVRVDSWSDANVLVSGRNYARLGFLANCGIAQHQVVTDRNPPDPFFLYTQYPVAPNVINGLWQAAGVDSVRIHRLLPAACSLAALGVWFLLLRRLVGRPTAAVATLAMATSYGFLAYADLLHFHAYAMLLCLAAVSCYVRAMAPSESRRARWFAATALLMFLTALFTWEYHLWMVLFVAGYALLFPCPVRRPYLALLGLPLAAALALQVAQRHWGLANAGPGVSADGAAGFLDDLRRRAIGFDEAFDTPPGLTLAGYPLHLPAAFGRFYGLPAVAAVVLIFLALAASDRPAWRPRDWPAEFRLLVVLVAAGVGWWLTMMQHTAVHAHTLRHMLPAYSLLMALTWAACARVLRTTQHAAILRGAAGLLLALTLYPHLEGLACAVRQRTVENFVDARGRSDSGVREMQAFSKLEAAVPAGGVILTNAHRYPPMRYGSRRPVYSGLPAWGPWDRSERPRVMLELSLNHLRELYGGDLPPLYYVYLVSPGDLRPQAASDSLLSLLLWGGREPPRAEADAILKGLVDEGRSSRTFCPATVVTDRLLCFDFAPAVPVLRGSYDALGFPTLRDFGPPR